MARVYRVKDGEWIEPKDGRYGLSCCDCGLAHDVYFRIVRGRVQFQAFRNKRATAAFRRWKKS